MRAVTFILLLFPVLTSAHADGSNEKLIMNCQQVAIENSPDIPFPEVTFVDGLRVEIFGKAINSLPKIVRADLRDVRGNTSTVIKMGLPLEGTTEAALDTQLYRGASDFKLELHYTAWQPSRNDPWYGGCRYFEARAKLDAQPFVTLQCRLFCK